MAIVYLSLRSNLGDRISFIQQAVMQLSSLHNTELVRTSSFYETEPWSTDTKNWFVNAVVELKTTLTPHELLDECMRIEQQLGRKRENNDDYSDRTIDIDILFYKNEIISEDDLIIPHKFLHLRAFVLVPLLELIPNFVHPVINKTITELHNDLENPETVYLYGTRI